MKIVKKGDKVKVEYEGTLNDGTIFDTTDKHQTPFEFEVGTGKLIKGFDAAIIGMKEGEQKNITLQPGDAYGDYNSELVKELPLDCFPDHQELKVGTVFMMELENGHKVPFLITAITDSTVTVDLNPPLAGKKLNFKIKLIEIAG
jgi:FKBP-type peptidyl-prolyl cis-trans isomerase 2